MLPRLGSFRSPVRRWVGGASVRAFRGRMRSAERDEHVRTSTKCLPARVVNAMRDAGAFVGDLGHPLMATTFISCEHRDPAYEIYRDYCLSCTALPPGKEDPMQTMLLFPIYPHDGEPIPPEPDIHNVMLEVNSIAIEYFKAHPSLVEAAGLNLDVGLPRPRVEPLQFDHALPALHLVHDRVASPGENCCPWINDLPVGTLLCVFDHSYKDTCLYVSVRRRAP